MISVPGSIGDIPFMLSRLAASIIMAITVVFVLSLKIHIRKAIILSALATVITELVWTAFFAGGDLLFWFFLIGCSLVAFAYLDFRGLLVTVLISCGAAAAGNIAAMLEGAAQQGNMEYCLLQYPAFKQSLTALQKRLAAVFDHVKSQKITAQGESQFSALAKAAGEYPRARGTQKNTDCFPDRQRLAGEYTKSDKSRLR